MSLRWPDSLESLVFSMFVFQNRFREVFSPAYVYSANNRLIESSFRSERSSKFSKNVIYLFIIISFYFTLDILCYNF